VFSFFPSIITFFTTPLKYPAHIECPAAWRTCSGTILIVIHIWFSFLVLSGRKGNSVPTFLIVIHNWLFLSLVGNYGKFHANYFNC